MLVPKINKNFSTDNTTRIIKIDSGSVLEQLSYNNTEILYEDKKKISFTKEIERIIRKSYEYKNVYIPYLKNELNITQCTFLPQIDIDLIDNVRIEFHHYPFTLFDIVNIVLDNRINRKKQTIFDPFDIAKEVTKLHFKNCIGLVPLSITAHETAHDGQLFINLKYVKGNYNKFIQDYNLNDNYDFINMINQLKDLSDKENISGELLSKDLFEVVMTIINCEDISPIKKFELLKENVA